MKLSKIRGFNNFLLAGWTDSSERFYRQWQTPRGLLLLKLLSIRRKCFLSSSFERCTQKKYCWKVWCFQTRFTSSIILGATDYICVSMRLTCCTVFFFAKVFFYFHNFLRPLRNTCHRRNSFTAIWQRVIFLSAMIILWRYLTLAWPEMFTRVVNTKRPRVQENFLSSGWRLNLSSTIVIPRKAMCKQLSFFFSFLLE